MYVNFSPRSVPPFTEESRFGGVTVSSCQSINMNSNHILSREYSGFRVRNSYRRNKCTYSWIRPWGTTRSLCCILNLPTWIDTHTRYGHSPLTHKIVHRGCCGMVVHSANEPPWCYAGFYRRSYRDPFGIVVFLFLFIVISSLDRQRRSDRKTKRKIDSINGQQYTLQHPFQTQFTSDVKWKVSLGHLCH